MTGDSTSTGLRYLGELIERVAFIRDQQRSFFVLRALRGVDPEDSIETMPIPVVEW